MSESLERLHKLLSCFLKYDLIKTIMCFHPTLFCFENGFVYPASFSHCNSVIVSLLKLRNTSGPSTMLPALFLFISAFRGPEIQQKERRTFLGTNIHWTAFVSQGISSFGKVCSVRYRASKRGKQTGDYCCSNHRPGRERGRKHQIQHPLSDQPKTIMHGIFWGLPFTPDEALESELTCNKAVASVMNCNLCIEWSFSLSRQTVGKVYLSLIITGEMVYTPKNSNRVYFYLAECLERFRNYNLWLCDFF